MSDQIISQIVRTTQAVPDRVESNAPPMGKGNSAPAGEQSHELHAAQAAQQEEPSRQAEAKAEHEEPTSVVNTSNNADVFLRFKVDEKTHDVTVFVLDRASREVVRTIPPEEITKLRSGELVSLFT